MKTSALKYGILSWVCLITMIIIVFTPFHAFLTVWVSSFVGHYTALRLWDELLLLIAAAGTAFLVLTDKKIRKQTLSRRLVWLIFAYLGLNLIWGLVGISGGDLTDKAFGYGLIVNTRFLIFFLITWAVALRTSRLRRNWRPLVLIPAAIVVTFGLLQALILPNSFLGHFGYNSSTIAAFETINHNSKYIRIESFLRGANPLGVYLIIPISFLTVLIVGGKRSWQYIALLIGSFGALFFTFSRSAWIGALLAVFTVLLLAVKSERFKKYGLLIAGGAVILLAAAGYSFRHNSHFENVVYHTETHSQISKSSNQGHLVALKSGLTDVGKHPLGFGPGSAGPASYYNNGKGRIAENYFIQIGQELGWLGLVLFVVINVGVSYLLWHRRDDPLAMGLFAALIGITFVNLLSHAWADDSLAYVWWGLAGIAMAPALLKESDEQNS